jgi:ATP-dependent exoDNAse (exonuclease V) alpha subunit
MVSGRQMSELLRVAEERSLRLVFAGDTRQIQSVEACDALRVLEKESRLKSVELTQVRRQPVGAYRDAIHELRRNPALGIARLEAMGAVREVAWLDRPQAIAQAFAEFQSQGRNSLVVCATHDEIDRVTEAIRSSRKDDGRLDAGMQLARDVPLGWTKAQKTDIRNFRPGQFLGFHRAVKNIAKNATLEVVKVEAKHVILRNEQGEARKITGKQAGSFDVYERRSIDVAAGDRLLLSANRRDRGFRATNGEIVTVASVCRSGMIQLQDGRVMPHNFRQFAYGYAVTAHRSQGKSVNSVIVSADGMRNELFYVAASRGREGVLVVTSDRELLRESVARSTTRQSASELAGKLRPGLHQGICRGLAAARRLADWTTRHLWSSRWNKSSPKLQKEPEKERSYELSISR